ncbi:MAG: hypothetical protein ACKPKO_21440, partial [Candidatus Fonsibacter sp.]
AKSDEHVDPETLLNEFRSGPKWCPEYLKGFCQKENACPRPHIEQATVYNIKVADRRQKEIDKGAAASP